MTRSDRHRLSELLGTAVVDLDGNVVGHVNDVRLGPGPAVHGTRAELVVEGIIVADRHAGSLLGYDRRREQGPWLVRRIVRYLHRRARYLPWSDVAELDWSSRTLVTANVAGTELEASR